MCEGNSLCTNSTGWLDIEHVYDNAVKTWDGMEPDEIREFGAESAGMNFGSITEDGLVSWLMNL